MRGLAARRLLEFALLWGLLFGLSHRIFSQTGMLFGKDHAFYMTAPPGWILDNKSGVNQGVHMLFYPLGYTYQNSPVIAYGRSITLTDKLRTVEDVVKSTIQNFKDNGHRNYSGRKEKTIQLPNGKTAEIYLYSGDRWGNYEAVGYILEKKTINFLVFHSRWKKAFDDNIEKFYKILKSYKNVYREDTEEYGEEQFKGYLKRAEDDSSSPEGKAYEDLLGETQGNEIKRLFEECLAYEKKKSEIPDVDAVFIVEEDGTIVDSYVWPVTGLSSCFKGAITSLKLPSHSLKQFHWHISLKFNFADGRIYPPQGKPAQTGEEKEGDEKGPRYLQIGNLPLNVFSIWGCYNPYEYWSWFSPATFVKFRITSETGEAKTISRINFNMTELTRDHISFQIMESSDIGKSGVPGAKAIPGKAVLMTINADAPPWERSDLFDGLLSLNFSDPKLFLDADGITPGEETLEIKGKPVETQRFTLTLEAPKVKTLITIWYTEEIPGGVARYKREIRAEGTSVLEEIQVEDFCAYRRTEAEFERLGWKSSPEVPGSTYLGKKLHFFEDERIFNINWSMFLKSMKEMRLTMLLPNITSLLEDATLWKQRFEEDRQNIKDQLSAEKFEELEPFLKSADRYCQTMLNYIAGEHEIWLQAFNHPETLDAAFKQKVEDSRSKIYLVNEARSDYFAVRNNLKHIMIRLQQEEPIDKDTTTTTQAHFKLGNFEIVVAQSKNKPAATTWARAGSIRSLPSLCDALITVFSEGAAIGSETFNGIMSLGGNYGIFFPYVQESDRHIILIKHGDYNSRTIIVDDHGHIHNLEGGRFRIFQKRYLISHYLQDGPTRYFAIFDLNENRILMKYTNNYYFRNFYTDGTSLFVKTDSYRTDLRHIIYRVDLDGGHLVETEIDESGFEEIVLDDSNLDLSTDCECKEDKKKECKENGVNLLGQVIRTRHWAMIYTQLVIYFGDRLGERALVRKSGLHRISDTPRFEAYVRYKAHPVRC